MNHWLPKSKKFGGKKCCKRVRLCAIESGGFPAGVIHHNQQPQGTVKDGVRTKLTSNKNLSGNGADLCWAVTVVVWELSLCAVLIQLRRTCALFPCSERLFSLHQGREIKISWFDGRWSLTYSLLFSFYQFLCSFTVEDKDVHTSLFFCVNKI